MRILVLGGTVFVGRHLVEAAILRGHDVTIFNRGREPLDASFPRVERLVGDRRGDLAPLRAGSWDAAIDAAAYVPSVARSAARALQGRVGHMTFVSTVSVYASPIPIGADEDAPIMRVDDEAVRRAEAIVPEGRSHARLYGPSYGGLKVRCEEAVREEQPRALVVRPGLVVGPFDATDRFTYWVRRAARGGKTLAPGRPERSVRFVDARDLARFTIASIEAALEGTFNVSGPDGLTMRATLEACARAAGTSPELVWVPDDVLLAEGVAMWSELPLWVTEDLNAFATISSARAITAGLRFRSLDDTCAATLAWDRARGEPSLEAGLDGAREQAILERFLAARTPHV